MNEQEQMEFFFEIFDPSMPRLGPGNDESTRRALGALPFAPPRLGDRGAAGRPRILDLGCGNGAQTIQLAKNVDGKILAVDNHEPYLEELRRRADAAGVSEKIETRLSDMKDLVAGDGPFDLIWSEGALYIMGFREGLKACRSLLTPGGSFAVTEISWLSPDVPEECRRFFAEEYPAMADIDANLGTITDCGYDVVGHFTLPESAWWEL